MNTCDTLKNKIKSIYISLRPSEQKVAEYIVKNIENIPEMSIVELSESIEVSQPTIIRFVKALGFKGYRQFKDSVIMELAENNQVNTFNPLYGFEIKKNDNIEDIPSKTIGTTIQILEQILKSISVESYKKAIDMIVNAQKIQIFGVENSRCVVDDLLNKLTYLGLNAVSYEDSYMQLICANNINENDLAIGVSYSGSSRDTVEAMKIAKDNGANTLVITNFEDAIINKYADISIFASNFKSKIYGNAIFSRTSQIAIIDMIYMGIISSDYDKYSTILDRNGIVSSNRSLNKQNI